VTSGVALDMLYREMLHVALQHLTMAIGMAPSEIDSKVIFMGHEIVKLL
jgi:hypothetical protein